MIAGLENVSMLLQSIVLVRIALNIVLYTKIGESQEAKKGGGMTEGVEVPTPYLTVHLQSVIPMERIPVVIIVRLENVA